MDVLGYQEDIHNLENIRKRRFLSYARILNSSLSSTNIMISNDNKVYMIDVCDTVSENKHRKLQKIKDTVRQAIIEI
jgi:serine/threonine-protein kinase RIO1